MLAAWVLLPSPTRSSFESGQKLTSYVDGSYYCAVLVFEEASFAGLLHFHKVGALEPFIGFTPEDRFRVLTRGG